MQHMGRAFSSPEPLGLKKDGLWGRDWGEEGQLRTSFLGSLFTLVPWRLAKLVNGVLSIYLKVEMGTFCLTNSTIKTKSHLLSELHKGNCACVLRQVKHRRKRLLAGTCQFRFRFFFFFNQCGGEDTLLRQTLDRCITEVKGKSYYFTFALIGSLLKESP